MSLTCHSTRRDTQGVAVLEDLEIPLAASLFWAESGERDAEWMIEIADRTGRLRLLLPYRVALRAHTANATGASFEPPEGASGEGNDGTPVGFRRPLRLIQGGLTAGARGG